MSLLGLNWLKTVSTVTAFGVSSVDAWYAMQATTSTPRHTCSLRGIASAHDSDAESHLDRSTRSTEQDMKTGPLPGHILFIIYKEFVHHLNWLSSTIVLARFDSGCVMT
jgi:hypothetical protein